MRGVAASPGIAIGKSVLKMEEALKADEREISPDEVDGELERLREGLEKAVEELKELQEETEKKLGKEEAEIFGAHQMLVQDPEMVKTIEEGIKKDKKNAEKALEEAVEQYASLMAGLEDEYMQAREADIRDVGSRILRILKGKSDEQAALPPDSVIIARDLTPSDTARLDKERVVAFLTADGSRTSHSAIMARSLGIPAVVGLGRDFLKDVDDGAKVIVDGNEGEVFLNPSEDKLKDYRGRLEEFEQEKKRLAQFKDVKAVTRDGEEIEVAGNIGNIFDVEPLLEQGGEGIGLFRTEFLYMDREDLPGEEEQFEAYKEVAQAMGDYPVIIRTLDIGGDKDLPYLELPQEMNPFLGYRAIRLCLDQPEIFKPQLRAILRASHYGNIKLMYPMIATLEEVKEANRLLTEIEKELEEEGIPFDGEMEKGIMIEVPGAVMIADALAGEVDFFSIGTNDLIQYTMAVDRGNERIAHLHSPYHPGVLKLIKETIEAGHRNDIWVGMCGEAAGDELLLPFLLGAGLDEFSMSAGSVLRIKELLGFWTKEEAKEITEKTLELGTAEEVEKFLKTHKKTEK